MDNKSRLIYAKQVFACRRCVFLSMLILFRSRQTITQREASREEWSTRAAMCVCMYACVGKHGCVDTGIHVWIIERSLEVKLPTIWTNGKQRWEESEKRREEERRSQKRKSQKKEDPGARKGRKSEKCTPLWREAHLQVKKLKTAHVRSTFWSWGVEKVHSVVALLSQNVQNTPCSDHFWKLRCRIEKVHAVMAQSTFRSQNVQNTPCSDHFWKLRCRKSARRGAKHISKSKCWKHHLLGPLLVVLMSFRVAGARDCAPCQKWAKREGFVAFPKTMAGVGHLKRICKDAFSVAGTVQETCSSELLGGPGADFLRVVAFWSIRSSGLLRWFCVTGAALRMTRYHFFVAGAVA